MKQLALQLGGYNVGKFPGLDPNLSNATLGSFISQILNVVFLVAGFLMFFWAFWGVFEYIFAGGNKEGLGKARARITWAIVGFIIVSAAFAISQFIEQLFPNK